MSEEERKESGESHIKHNGHELGGGPECLGNPEYRMNNERAREVAAMRPEEATPHP